MTTENKTHQFDAKTNEIIKAIKATSSPTVLSSVVKAAIHTRDNLLGKDDIEALELKLEKIADAAARKRAKGLCDRIGHMTDSKAVAFVCRLAITNRAHARAKKTAKKAG